MPIGKTRPHHRPTLSYVRKIREALISAWRWQRHTLPGNYFAHAKPLHVCLASYTVNEPTVDWSFANISHRQMRLASFSDIGTTEHEQEKQRKDASLRSDGCLFLQHRDRDSGSSFIYYTFQHRPRRACLLVYLFVCLLVCLFRSVCFFVPLFFTVQRPRLGFVIYLIFAAGTDPL